MSVSTVWNSLTLTEPLTAYGADGADGAEGGAGVRGLAAGGAEGGLPAAALSLDRRLQRPVTGVTGRLAGQVPLAMARPPSKTSQLWAP